KNDLANTLVSTLNHELRSLLRVAWVDLGGQDAYVGSNAALATIFELDLGLDVLIAAALEQRFDQHAIFFGDETAPDLAGTREFVVVGVEFLVQHQEARHLGGAQFGIGRQIGIDLLHAVADQVLHFGLARQVDIPGIGKPAPLGPVAHGFEIDVDEGTHLAAARPKSNRLFDVGEELELVLDVLGGEQAAVGELADILCPVDDLELAVGIEIAGVPRVIPAVSREGFSRGLGVLVVSLEQTRALDLNFTVFGDTDLDTRDGWPHRIGAHLAVGLNADEHRGFSGPVQLLEVDADGAVEL